MSIDPAPFRQAVGSFASDISDARRPLLHGKDRPGQFAVPAEETTAAGSP